MRVGIAIVLLSACSYRPPTHATGDGENPPPDDAPLISPDMKITPDWAFKRTLTIDNTNLGALSSFALAVTLDGNRITYSSASPTGADLRFSDANDTSLAYEIERWDPAGRSTIWVRVPAIAAGTTTAITMFYGNPAAVDAQTPAAVWDDDYVGVWHLVDAHDSTGQSVSTNNGATPIAGKTGPALAFSGANQFVDTGNKDHLATWTVETWMNPTTAAASTGASSVVSGFPNYMILWSCNGAAFCRTVMYNSANPVVTHIAGFNVPVVTWSHVVGRYDGAAIESYVGGARVDKVATTAAPDVSTLTTKIGTRMDQLGDFVGGIDEVRISKIARSPDYIAAHFRSTSDTYVAYGPEQSN